MTNKHEHEYELLGNNHFWWKIYKCFTCWKKKQKYPWWASSYEEYNDNKKRLRSW